MKACIVLLALSLAGCSGLDRLVASKDGARSDDYEPSYPSQPVERSEPYAVFSGYHKTGQRLYVVHWHGNELDGLGLLENIVDAMSMPKYKD